MNEFFATTADVYRLTGELDAAHDQQPSADNAAKDLAAHPHAAGANDRAGRSATAAPTSGWHSPTPGATQQVAELSGQLERVMAAHGLRAAPPCWSAPAAAPSCCPSLAPAGLAASAAYGRDMARIAAQAPPAARSDWAEVCAPSVAVAALFDRDQR